MSEQTVEIKIETDSDEAVWMGDANVVLMPSHLDTAGREQALCNLAAKWRRKFIRVVSSVA